MATQILTTNTQANANGVSNFATGSVVADAGVAAAETFTLGFVPKYICFENLTDSIKEEWFTGMTSPGAVKTVLNGTRSLETTGGITVTGNTFTVPAAIMVASKTFGWWAVG